MPFLGGGISRRKAYMWLYHSTRDFLTRQELIRLFVLSDLKNVRDEERMFGACVLIEGTKPVEITTGENYERRKI